LVKTKEKIIQFLKTEVQSLNQPEDSEESSTVSPTIVGAFLQVTLRSSIWGGSALSSNPLPFCIPF